MNSPPTGRTLVTGGCGFIGSRVCEQLVQVGGDVVVIDDLSLGRPENLSSSLIDAVDIRLLDIRDVDGVSRVLQQSRPTRVIHLAAIHFIPRCESDPVGATEVNVGGTQALLTAVEHASSVESFVLASSGAVYRPSSAAHRETDEIEPTDVYGHTKRSCEELVRRFHDRTGMPAGIARIFNTFGPGETNPHLIPTVIVQLRDRRRVLVGNLSTCRDYVFVDDVAAALAKLADAASRHGVLICNVGTGRAVEGTQLVAVIARLLGQEVEIIVDERRVRADDRRVLLSDCSTAQLQLGWTATTGLDEGLRAAVERPVANEATFAY